MRFAGRGHAEIRATHAKTLELDRHDDITARATCVIAVAATADPPAPMAGPVLLEISVAGQHVTVHARANPSWEPLGPAVVRRTALRLPGTFATESDTTAADLPRAFVAALQDPSAVIEVVVEAERETVDTLVLFAADAERGDDPRLRAELAAADTVIAEDVEARRLVRAHDRGRPGRETADGPGRLLVVATTSLPGASLDPQRRRVERLETVGLPPGLAAAAASPTAGPVVEFPAGADLHGALRSTPATHRLVVAVRADQVQPLLTRAAVERGSGAGTLARLHAPPRRVTTEHSGTDALPAAEPVHLCLDAAPDAGPDSVPALDPAARAAARALLADGVSTRTIARALAEFAGLSRREAYDAVLRLAAVNPAPPEEGSR